MYSFNATETANGNAHTSTTPPYLITSSASATATANSDDNAKKIANDTAKQLANSVAQNDANIISQTLNLSPAGVIGQYNHLNISYAFKIPINGQGEFTGMIKPSNIDESSNDSDCLILTANKKVHDANTFQRISKSSHFTTNHATFYNYGGKYGDKIVNDELFTSSTPKSVLISNRSVSTSIPIIKNNIPYTYKIKITAHVKHYVSDPITNTTEYSDFNKKIYGVKVDSKSVTALHIINENENTIASYTGVTIKETYDKTWNIITLDFSKAFQSSVIQNTYPVDIRL